MKHSGFPLPQNTEVITGSSLFSDNTRSLIIDVNKANLKIFENIITKLNMISDDISKIINRLDMIDQRVNESQLLYVDSLKTIEAVMLPSADVKRECNTIGKPKALAKRSLTLGSSKKI